MTGGNDAQTKRCAIYARKSHEEGLEQDYNSLDAQRDACRSYIRSQQWSGWIPLKKTYEDGGFSGANTDRPALQELLEDIVDGKVDIVVVYKIDRLSRSLCDFADLFQVFEKHGVSFVSVTQQIDTSTSAGRMMLNILMTFAQYEREVIAERIKDKFHASRKKGIFMGGRVPFGYKVAARKLVINPEEAEIVREMFQRYAEIASAKHVIWELAPKLRRLDRQLSWEPNQLYRMMENPLYIGKVRFEGEIYDGEQPAIVSQRLWEEVQDRLREARRGKNKIATRSEISAPLKGVLHCGHCGGPMYPTYTKKGSIQYHYYYCKRDSGRRVPTCPIGRIPAGEIDDAVARQICRVLQSDAFISLLAEAGVKEEDARKTLANVPKFWDALFPVERLRLFDLLVEKVVAKNDGLDITLKTKGLKGLVKELKP